MPIISAPIATRPTPSRLKHCVKVNDRNVVQGCFPEKHFSSPDIRAFQLCAYVIPEAFHVVLFERAGGRFAGSRLFQTGAMEECDILPDDINQPVSEAAIARALIREGQEETNLPAELIAEMLIRKNSQLLGYFDTHSPGGPTYRFYCAVIETRPEEIIYFNPCKDPRTAKICFVSLHSYPGKVNKRGTGDALFGSLFTELQRIMIEYRYHSASNQFTIIDKIKFIGSFKKFKGAILTAVKGKNLIALPPEGYPLIDKFSRRMGIDAYLLQQAALFLVNLYRGAPDQFLELSANLINAAMPPLPGKETFLQSLLLEERCARGFQPLKGLGTFPRIRVLSTPRAIFRPL